MSLIAQTKVTVEEVLCHMAASTSSPSTMGAQINQLMASDTGEPKSPTQARWCPECGRKPKMDKRRTKCECGRPYWAEGAAPGLMKTKATPSRGADLEARVLKDSEVSKLLRDLDRLKGVDIDEAKKLVGISYAAKTSVGAVMVKTLRAYHSTMGALTEEEIARATARADRCGRQRKGFVVEKTGKWSGGVPCNGPDNCPCEECKWDRSYKRACDEYRAPKSLEAVREAYGLKTTAEAAELYGDCLLVLSLFVQTWNRKQKAA